MMGGFNSACFGSVMVETGCWTAFSYQNRADGKLLVDEFGEGCRGGAGRIPKTFKHPTGIVDAPRIEIAGDLKAPFPGWAGCDADGNNCKSGDVDGGAISSHVQVVQSVPVSLCLHPRFQHFTYGVVSEGKVSEKGVEILWKFCRNLRKLLCNDPFPNNPISEFEIF